MSFSEKIFLNITVSSKLNQTFKTSRNAKRHLDLSMVHVFFRDLKVFKYHTDELFSWENILG